MLAERWYSLLTDALDSPPPPPLMAQSFARLDRDYSNPVRAYHNWHHIAECLAWKNACASTLIPVERDRHLLELALFYHDAVYEPGRSDNEEQSARLATSELPRIGFSAEYTYIVSDLVRATAHTNVAPDPHPAIRSIVDALSPVITDIDLAILGASRERFVSYEEQIREEYAFMDPGEFRRGRRAILERLLARPEIYRTSYFHGRLEHTARENISRMLDTFYSM